VQPAVHIDLAQVHSSWGQFPESGGVGVTRRGSSLCIYLMAQRRACER
jgi:hypothetical protein